MSSRRKAREIWFNRYRAALVQACGAAAILGFTDHAATLCEMIDAARADIDSAAEMRYNQSDDSAVCAPEKATGGKEND